MTGHRARVVVLAATLVAWAAGAAHAAAPERLRVDYRAPVVTIEAESAPLQAVLRELSERVGFTVEGDSGGADPVTGRLVGPIETVLRQLLAGTSHVLVYEASRLQEVLLLTPRGGSATASGVAAGGAPPPAPPVSVGRSPGAAGPPLVAPGAASVLSPAVLPGDRLIDLAADLEAPGGEVTVERLLGAQALHGLRVPTPEGGPARLPEPPPILEREPDARAMAGLTLKAQEGMRALVDALAAAEAELRVQLQPIEVPPVDAASGKH